jgi:hypothetical protein
MATHATVNQAKPDIREGSSSTSPPTPNSRRLRNRWEAICNKYLPVTSKGSIWRYSRKSVSDGPSQGWKIHITATVLTAGDILTAIAPALDSCGVPYKAPISLDILMWINSGIFYGYSQVGKIITIYPHDEDEFVRTVHILSPLLTKWPAGPAVPFDLRFGETCIYYRYGAFKSAIGSKPQAAGMPNVVSPDGDEIEDRRSIPPDQIPWLRDPFAMQSATVEKNYQLNNRYVVCRALTQRGKGGVYEAIDVRQNTPRFCVIKEGRKNGETMWDGRDGRARIENEARVLGLLASNSANVPRIIDRFDYNANAYLVIEHIEGVNLQSFIAHGTSTVPAEILLELCRQICEIVASIHNIGWLWRDCKPSNLIVDMKGDVKAVDFEGACPENSPDPFPWSTPLFSPPELSAQKSGKTQANRAHDLYALGACMDQLLSEDDRVKSGTDKSIRVRRPEISVEVTQLVSQLLSDDPRDRPDAMSAARILG